MFVLITLTSTQESNITTAITLENLKETYQFNSQQSKSVEAGKLRLTREVSSRK